MPGDISCKVYVGELSRNASEYELEREFEKFGKLRNVWVARQPPGFAFVEFEDPRDADDAVHELDGKEVCGSRIRVEHSNGKVRPKPWLRRGGGGGGRGGRYDDDRDKCYECGRHGHFAAECRSRRRSRSRDRRDRSRSRDRRSRSRSRDRRSRSRSYDDRRRRDSGDRY